MSEREPRQAETTPLPLPFPLPPDFLSRLGYRRQRRFVATFWEPAGDEAAWSDGEYTFVGAAWRVFLELVADSRVEPWLDKHQINLGDCEQEATHWLVIDRTQQCAYVAPRGQARDIVRRQRLEPYMEVDSR